MVRGKRKGQWRKGFAEEPSLELRMKYWASKRKCKRWYWRWWRWWTALCDKWKCRRLCLTRLAEISGEFVP